MAKIAHTRTRLKGNVILSTFPGGFFGADAATLLKAFQDSPKGFPVLGATQHLTIGQTRNSNNVRREFNPDQQGKPAETYPGLPNYSIKLKRTDLYDINMIEAFGFTGINIVDQYAPILVIASQVVPVDLAGNPLQFNGQPMKARTYMITGCWFNALPLEFDITDEDQKFVQEVDMIAADVYAA